LRFVTIQRDGDTEPGVLLDGRVIPINGSGLSSVLEVIAGGADAQTQVRRWIGGPASSHGLDPAVLTFAAPIPRPPKLICIGLNYRDHAAESKLAIPEVPTMFAKFSTAVIGPGQPIVLPRNSAKPDYEAEFAVVIGRRGRHVAENYMRD
jgi:2-keto-4-pentenoate hydratase/2-oxohepta-3-ene-1,7-dioic acid hydratase in catechol pathway